MNKYLKNETLPYILDEITGKPVLLVGMSIHSDRIFLRLYDGDGIYKREVIFKK